MIFSSRGLRSVGPVFFFPAFFTLFGDFGDFDDDDDYDGYKTFCFCFYYYWKIIGKLLEIIVKLLEIYWKHIITNIINIL